jgi:hypothetical protein
MHVVLGVNTYRDVSVASTIRVEPDEEFVNAVVGCSHKTVTSVTRSCNGPVRKTAQNGQTRIRRRRKERKRAEPTTIVWADTKSENHNFYQCGYCDRDDQDLYVQPDTGDWTLVKTRYRRRRRRNLNVKRRIAVPGDSISCR